MEITTKHARNSPVAFVTHKCFAVLFFLPFHCVNSLLKTEVQSRGPQVVTGRRIEGKLPFIFLILITPRTPFGQASWRRVRDGVKLRRSDLSWFRFRPLTHCSTLGGGGTQQSFIRGGSILGSNPLPFLIPFIDKLYPFQIHNLHLV